MSTNPVQALQEQVNWHWRNTMRPVRFFNLDARAALPLFALLFYFRIITLVLCTICMLTFHVVEKLGLTVPSALRKLRSLMTGDRRLGWVAFRYRRFKDYG